MAAIGKEKTPAAHGWLWSVSGRNKWHILALLLIQISLAVCGVAQAMALRGLIDRAVDRDAPGFRVAAALLAGLIVLQLALRAVLRFLKEYTRSALENRFKDRLFAALLYKDYAHVTAVHSEEWMNRLTSDTVVIADGLTEIVPEVAGMLVRLTGALVMVLVLVHGFTWLLLPCGLALAAFTYVFRRRLKELHKRIQEADGRLRVFLSERLSNLLIVRSFTRERETLHQGEAAMAEHRAERMRRNRFSNLCNVGFGVLIQGAYCFAAVYCAHGILTGTLSYGTFTAVLQLIGQIQSPFANLSGYVPRYFAMIASAERLMEAERFPDDLDAPRKDAEEIERFYREGFRGIALRDVCFTYESGESARPVVLSGVELHIQKGDTVAITGPSGCGKSTLLKLLMCLYPLDGGERLLLSGEGVQPLTAEWRGLFAYVPQGNQLMSGSIRRVVSFGEERFSDGEIYAALRIACAEDFVRALPEGLDTLLGERGAGLSEGQMQRLAIARAVLSGHPVLLLDEATSSLDGETERELLGNLQAMTDRTVLIVTHRLQVLDICARELHMSESGIQVKELRQDG